MDDREKDHIEVAPDYNDKDQMESLAKVIDSLMADKFNKFYDEFKENIDKLKDDLKEGKETAIYVNPEAIQAVEIRTSLGDYIEEHRISKTWLAEVTGLNRGTIINMIKNPNSASMLNVKKVCLALGKNTNELFY